MQNNDEMVKLVGSYKRVFLTPEGEHVLEDLRNFTEINQPIGSDVTHAQCAYRNGMQDLYKYIDALVSDE